MFSGFAFAQVPQQNAQRSQLPPPLTSRTVSGVVKDSTDSTLPGAVIKLVSAHDTLSTSTNMDGIFIFKNVKMATFVLTVSSIGYRTQAKKLLNNDTSPRLTLDPIVLKSEAKALNEVVINGTPSIVYKVDTVEYRASDYKVRPNATLDELLKKMEGMEVGSDGSLTHQGQSVTKVKLNGKDYAGGDVAQAIQNLPADIIEKAQIVDDYGDQAARSGIKSGDPQKILNVTTKADRSVGTTGRLTAQAGDHDRYIGNVFIQRINANQQLGLIGDLRNTVTGIASTGSAGGTGGSPGVSKHFSPSFNYRDQYSKEIQVVAGGRFSNDSRESVSQSYGTTTSNGAVLAGGKKTGPSSGTFARNGNAQSNNRSNGANFELDYQIDSLNYLQFQPNYSYSSGENYNFNNQDRNIRYQNPEDQLYNEFTNTNGNSNSKNESSGVGGLLLFNHRFKKLRRNFSVQVSYNYNINNSTGENNNRIKYFSNEKHLPDSLTRPDSVVHLLSTRQNITNNYRASMTYSEPLGFYSQLEFNGQITRNAHQTNNTQDSVSALTGERINLPRLSNIFNYATTESRFNFNYRYQGTRVNLSLGASAVPYNLSGTKLDNGLGANASSNKNDFKILPILRFSYSWSRTQRFTLNYTGTNNEPDFAQIQPFTDRSDINNIVVGNPDLKPSFTNSISASYNNYFPNSRFNLSFNGSANFYSDQVVTNTFTYSRRIPPTPTNPLGGAQSYRVQEFVNLSGSRYYGGNYNISKQLADRRYNLQLNGRIGYTYNVDVDNDIPYHNNSWEFNERFGPRITPSDNVEVNPYIGTDMRRSFSTNGYGSASKAITNSLGIDGRFYFLKTYQVHYAARKSLISQTSQINRLDGPPTVTPSSNNSPLVIDGGFQKEFGQKRQFTLTFDMYDLLHQNNYIEQVVTPTSTTNTISSSLSRYFLIGFRLNLQRWSGKPQRGGREMQRRGDGSFIYN